MRPILTLLIVAIPTCAMAAGVPEFLKGKRYTYSEETCVGEDELPAEEDADITTTLEVNEAGIFAYEFGCIFLDFWPGDTDSDMPFLQTVVASCGDDSGVTRPDLISLVFDTSEPESVTVTSQNEYVMGQTFISRTYPLCPEE